MSKDRKISTPSIADAMALAHERMEDLFRRLGAGLPADLQREISSGVDAILIEILSQHPAGRTDASEFMSTAEAAMLLFDSRPHVVKLLEQGKLNLHHKSGNNRYVTRASVLHYQSACQMAAKAYRTSASDEE
ncbi:hypothetical protein SB861_07315 [Paraburkholderia sp. SIMBA_049]